METPTPRIPTLALVSKAYTHAGTNLGQLWRIVGGWVALYGAATLVSYFGLAWLIATNIDFRFWVEGLPSRAQDLLFGIVPTLVSLIAVPAVAVAWHRLMLLAETPRGFLPFKGGRVAQYTGRVMITLGVLMIFMLLVLPVLAAMTAGLQPMPGASNIVVLVPLALWAAALYVFARTGVALPAAAVADSKWTVERSWHETHDDGLSLLGGTLLVIIPFLVARGFASFIAVSLAADNQILPYAALSMMSFAVALAGVAVGAGFYSFVYEFKARPAGAADRPPASHFS